VKTFDVQGDFNTWFRYAFRLGDISISEGGPLSRLILMMLLPTALTKLLPARRHQVGQRIELFNGFSLFAGPSLKPAADHSFQYRIANRPVNEDEGK
jgi:hypothetical protein